MIPTDTNALHNWDADLYDDKISYVSRLGKEVVKLLDPQPEEKILDLGCGTGDLTDQIAKLGASVTGIDNSTSMIEKAKHKYPGITFLVDNGESFRIPMKFDAVFSNAALHWMKRASDVIESIWIALRPGGRFAAEFGGKGNVQTIIKAVNNVLAGKGLNVSEINPWYYPSIAEYSSLLEGQGFRVVYAVHFDRMTPLEDGENGLRHWLDMFAGSFFAHLTAAEKSEAYSQVTEKLRPLLYTNGIWTADYKRIRIKAIKE